MIPQCLAVTVNGPSDAWPARSWIYAFASSSTTFWVAADAITAGLDFEQALQDPDMVKLQASQQVRLCICCLL